MKEKKLPSMFSELDSVVKGGLASYGVSYDAAWLGNGCSPAMPLTKDASAKSAAGRIQPAPNVNP